MLTKMIITLKISFQFSIKLIIKKNVTDRELRKKTVYTRIEKKPDKQLIN